MPRLRRSLPVLLVSCLALAGCSDSKTTSDLSVPEAHEWRLYGGSFARTFFNPNETMITKATASRLVPRWRFTTGAVVTASPIVAFIDRPGEPKLKTIFVSSWDGNLYALRARDGSIVWSYTMKPHPGASYPQASSAAVVDVNGRRLVYVGGGMTLYCLDATTGELIWQFDAGTGCTDCDFLTERNEILSSPAVHEGLVYFGMDINDFGTGKGGFYAVDAQSGLLRWYFDLETTATCRPNPDDQVRHFDGYHSAAALGLPADFFATRDGCNFDRRGTACGNVWSSATIDVKRRLLYTTSSNCDTDDDPATPEPPPPMPPRDEAIFALTLDGAPAWVWRPREVDNEDLAVGAVPNLFEVEIGGAQREVVGYGDKSGEYYVLDRDGTNELTGRVEPYWRTKVVPGGDIGGIIASSAVGEGKILFSTAAGTDVINYQKPAAHALRATDGSILWENQNALPSFGPTSAIPGVVFMGSIGGALFAYDSDTGEELARLRVAGPLSSAATVLDGELYVGAGTGARGGSPAEVAFQTSLIPSPISAFCLSGEGDCPQGGSCDDGNSCTTDGTKPSGGCDNSALPDGTNCQTATFPGQCRGGVCILFQVLCDDQNQCTQDVTENQSCRHAPEPDGKRCVVDDKAGECRSGACVKL
jgi:polyvinyl alcohol dehydrogenase (cytochrome)